MNFNVDRYNVWMTQIFGISQPKIHKMIERYGSSKKVYEALKSGDVSLLDEKEKYNLKNFSLSDAEKILAFCEKRYISVTSLGSPEYPKLLAEIYDPPLVLYYRGDLSCLDELSLTFVGTREPYNYILKLCSRICRDIGKLGVTFVSGMARGVDECVHSTCVANGIKTVGVLACGTECDYPYGSKILREKMIMGGGAYMTEYLPNTRPTPDYFNPRNRILAGLSRGTAVFQAAVDSGALITASYALDEGRDVFCVPPPDVFDPAYEGVIEFIRDGAIPIFNHDDILKEYVGLYL